MLGLNLALENTISWSDVEVLLSEEHLPTHMHAPASRKDVVWFFRDL